MTATRNKIFPLLFIGFTIFSGCGENSSPVSDSLYQDGIIQTTDGRGVLRGNAGEYFLDQERKGEQVFVQNSNSCFNSNYKKILDTNAFNECMKQKNYRLLNCSEVRKYGKSMLVFKKMSAAASEAISHAMKSCLERAQKIANVEVKFNYNSDYMEQLLGNRGDWPVSNWQTHTKKNFATMMEGARFDILVVPTQVRGYGIDRIGRTLITLGIYERIRQNTKSTVADMYLVTKALGENARSYTKDNVYRLADVLRAKTIVYSYVGHDNHYNMRLELSVEKRIPDEGFVEELSKKKLFENIKFSDEKLPYMQAQPLLDNVLPDLGLYQKSNRKKSATTNAIKENLNIYTSPLDLARHPSNHALENALFLQLIASIAPVEPSFEREYLFSRSIIALKDIPQSTPKYRYILARSLFYLNRLPAARKLLGTPKSEEEKFLLSLLDGNLLALEKQRKSTKNNVIAMLSAIDYIDLGYRYASGIKSKDIVNTIKASDEWKYFLLRRFEELDGWYRYSNLELKKYLDKYFQIKNFTLKDIENGKVFTGSAGEIENTVDLSVYNHLTELQKNNPNLWCCEDDLNTVKERDYLTLIQNISEFNLYKKVEVYYRKQGLPERAISLDQKYLEVYSGHPLFVSSLAGALQSKSKREAGIRSDSNMQQAGKEAQNVLFWYSVHSEISADAMNIIDLAKQKNSKKYDQLLENEFPVSTYWFYSTKDAEKNKEIWVKQLAYTNYDFSKLWAILLYAGRDDKKFDEIVKKNEHRFVGNPEKNKYFAERLKNRGQLDQAILYYEKSIAQQPNVWSSYLELGRLLVKKGLFNDANRVFISFPRFNDFKAKDSVTLSNGYYHAGSLFYSRGMFDLAKPLYEFSSKLETGSYAGLTSQARLYLIDGDYQRAASVFLSSGKRYDNATAYNNFFSLLHIMGYSKPAWNGFYELLGNKDHSRVWYSALIGHRIEGISVDELTEWLQQERTRRTTDGVFSQTARYFILYKILDRIPPHDLPEIVQKLEANSDKAYKLSSRHLAEFFTKFYYKEYDGFSHRSFIRSLENDYQYSPYIVYALTKTGKIEKIKSLLKRFSRKDMLFDYYLSNTIFLSAQGKHSDAIDSLKTAQNVGFKKRLVPSEYVFAEFCEKLYLDTGENEYKNMLLDWVKKLQTITPMHAWPYAIEAKYMDVVERKIRSLGIALYLDRESMHLKKFTEKEKSEAKKWFRNHNPFKTMASEQQSF